MLPIACASTITCCSPPDIPARRHLSSSLATRCSSRCVRISKDGRRLELPFVAVLRSRPDRLEQGMRRPSSVLCARNLRVMTVALPAFATVLWTVCFGQSSSPSKKSAASDAGQVAALPYYGGDPGGSRFSPLTQINRSNVQQLKVAWVYHTGDVSDGTKHPRRSAFETTPIMVDGTLYFSTAFNRVLAIDPETGAERWSYDP